MQQQAIYFGLQFYELLTLIGIVAGPIVAVLVTLWVDGRRRDREQKIVVFRHLLATRHLPADPGFLAAINLIPVEFNSHESVLTAYNEFIDASRARLDGVNDAAIQQNMNTKLTRLIFQVSQSLGFKIRETDIQTTAYASEGWIKRDALLQDSQQAMREVANALWLQTRMMSGETWDQIKNPSQPKIADANDASSAGKEK